MLTRAPPTQDPTILTGGGTHIGTAIISGGGHAFGNNSTVINYLTDTHELKKIQSITSLPRAHASHRDYETKKKTGPCFPGTREALLQEMMDWVTGSSDSRMYILSGLAGISKSTVAYTIASRTAHPDLNFLGGSFFFSRDEADRNNAKKFFTTVAYQLCAYDETFSKAIRDVLLTEHGFAATTRDPQEQLQILILNPLRNIVQPRTRPILVVVDALDECDEEDERAVVMGLSQLVRCLPTFKVILTTRPQPLINYLFYNHEGHKMFRLQDIEDKVVDSDIRLYLSHSLSQEQVRGFLQNAEEQWYASDEEIESLVMATGRLFIIASTAVLYVLNKTLGDPGSRMKQLLDEIAHDHTPFHALNRFYSIIIRSAIQMDGHDDHMLDFYQIVIGTIVVIQTPLPVTTLASFIGVEPKKIYAMLRHLQSVILLGGDDVPHIYHKSFPDFLTDPSRCTDGYLQIDPKIRHTWIGIRCFEIMDDHLKYNILGLGDPARFMSNEDGLRGAWVTAEHLQKKVPQQLRYACVYWANHLVVANIEDIDLMNGLSKLVDEHMLHWFEVLSLIGKLEYAHLAIRLAVKQLELMSSDLHQFFLDALRFISKFYELIKQSALHTYYSALPFAPRDSLLYRRYIKKVMHNNVWESSNGTLFVSYSEEGDKHRIRTNGALKVWDASTGTPISTVPGCRFTLARDFSTIAPSKENIITFYNANGVAQSAIFTASSKIQKLALSSESSRIAAVLYDGVVCLWNSENAKLINSFDGLEGSLPENEARIGELEALFESFESCRFLPQLEFSPTGTRLAYSSPNSIVKLRDGLSGIFIADLRCGSRHDFVFSGDGSRIASRSLHRCLKLWNSESGRLMVDVRDNVTEFAISVNGSFLGTANYDDDKIKLWNGNGDLLDQINLFGSLRSMAFSRDDIFAFTTKAGIVKLYNINTRTFISALPFIGKGTALVFSLDCTHLAAGNGNGTIYLWDTQGIETTILPLVEEGTCVTVLALSRDCSRLVCGFSNGKVELWKTRPTKQRVTSLLTRTFGLDLTDGTLHGTLKAPDKLQVVAVSNRIVAAGWHGGVGLRTIDKLSFVQVFKGWDDILSDDVLTANVRSTDVLSLSISDDSNLVAMIAINNRISLFSVLDRTVITTFDFHDNIYKMTFLPDNSRLMGSDSDGNLYSVDINKRVVEGSTLEHLIQLPNFPLWHHIPILYNKKEHCLAALFSTEQAPVPVLWIPRELHVEEWAQGSSIIHDSLALQARARYPSTLACRVILTRMSLLSNIVYCTYIHAH